LNTGFTLTACRQAMPFAPLGCILRQRLVHSSQGGCVQAGGEIRFIPLPLF